ncbi:Uncharacterized protein Adt_39527 [Abeliophyllum distichum]|uniref:Uncharacterized protein n=1 Tax=Abeliophyllum distichum TaxID=126358 RepID=A0ABD1Q5F6_9LAMI
MLLAQDSILGSFESHQRLTWMAYNRLVSESGMSHSRLEGLVEAEMKKFDVAQDEKFNCIMESMKNMFTTFKQELIPNSHHRAEALGNSPQHHKMEVGESSNEGLFKSPRIRFVPTLSK